MYRKTIISLAVAVIGQGLFGQTDSLWTLDACVDHAIAYNLQVKRQELNVQSTGQDNIQSKMSLLPNLNGQYEHELGSGRVLDRYDDYRWKDASVSQGGMGVQSDFTLFNGLQGLNNMKMTKATYLMNVEELEAMEDNITLQVMTGYLDLLRNRELVTVAESKVEVTLQQVERMEKLVEVGNEPQGRLLEVKATMSADELALTQAVNAREIARLNLMHIMNVGTHASFEIEQPSFPDPADVKLPELDSVYSYALANLPQIKSAEHGIEAQARYLAMMQGQRSPRLYARGLYYSNYSDGLPNPDPNAADPTYAIPDQIRNNQYKQVSLGIQIPFFNRWRVQTDINKAKIQLQDAEYGLQTAVLELQQAIQQYHTEALAALDNYESASEAVANSDEAYRFAEERFRVGTGTSLELQEARNQLYSATSQQITSRYVLIFYTKILDFYMGREIEF